MTAAVSLRVHVRLPNAPGGPAIVETSTFDALLALLPPLRWEPMLTPDQDGYGYRAWLRAKGEGQSPQRIMGRPAATADEAVRNLIGKIEPLARPAGAVR